MMFKIHVSTSTSSEKNSQAGLQLGKAKGSNKNEDFDPLKIAEIYTKNVMCFTAKRLYPATCFLIHWVNLHYPEYTE